MQFRELPGIATVRLDAVAGLAWDQGRRNDVAAQPAEMQLTVQGVAARPRFVATLNGPRRKTGQLPAQPFDGPRLIGDSPGRWRALMADQHRNGEIFLVRVNAYVGDSLLHDRLYMDASRWQGSIERAGDRLQFYIRPVSCRTGACWPRWNQPTRASFLSRTLGPCSDPG